LSKIKVPKDVVCDLLISIDKSNCQEQIKEISDNFYWEFGEKKIDVHSTRLGIKKHVFYCVGKVQKYDLLLMFEDDLYVSSEVVSYVLQSVEYIKSSGFEICIGGISTYSPRYNETSLLPFHPITAFDNFYLQLPSSWGQAWTPLMWESFMHWYNEKTNFDFSSLPSNIQRWSSRSWKKIYTLYLIESGKYFFYPSCSFSTNFGDAGEHMKSNNMFQVPMNSYCSHFNFCDISGAPTYDSYMDISPKFLKQANDQLKRFDFVVNLSGDKLISSEILQISYHEREVTELSWAIGMVPNELAIAENVHGQGIFLTRGKFKKPLRFIRFYVCRSYPFSNLKGIMRRIVRLLLNG